MAEDGIYGSWPSVETYHDGQDVSAGVLNTPLRQLANRTEYLLGQVRDLRDSGRFEAVSFDVPLADGVSFSKGDIVCLDPLTGKYVKALATMSVFDSYDPSFTCRAVGMLTSVGVSSGVVAALGYVDLSGYDMSSMMEGGGEFSTGFYYVSSREAGKLTADPRGPLVQIGEFVANAMASGPSNGDFAVIRPQHQSLGEHRHRTVPLVAAPAGGQETTVGTYAGELDLVYSMGYLPNGVRDGTVPIGQFDCVPRLRLSGSWSSPDDTSYTVWLSREQSGDSPAGSQDVSSSFGSVYLHWVSQDPDEGSGVSRVTGFYEPVEVGSKGLVVFLEPGKPGAPVNALFSIVSGEDSGGSTTYEQYLSQGGRTWSVEMPRYARGWTENDVRGSAGIDGGYLRVRGCPMTSAKSVNVMPLASFHALPSTKPEAGDTLAVTDAKTGSTLNYAFVGADADLSAYDGTSTVPVLIQGGAFETFASIARVPDDGCNVVICPCEDERVRRVYVGGASSVEYNDEELQPVLSGATSGRYCLVFSDSGDSLVARNAGTELSPSYVGYADFGAMPDGTVVGLANGLDLYIVSIGSSASMSSAVSQHSVLSFGCATGCNGAAFRYAIEMDGGLNSVYPPSPLGSASLMWNGVELESKALFGGDALYCTSYDSLYWYDRHFGRVPWPSAFTDIEAPLSPEHRHRLLYHMVSAFHSDTGPVTSLRPADGSPVRITRCATGVDGATGDLEVDIDLAAEVADASVSGYKAVKRGKGGRLLLGPVVERVVAGPGIEVTQSAGMPDGQGVVRISLSDSSYSGYFDTVALENAKQEMVGMFPYVRLLGWSDGGSNIDSGFVAKFQIPHNVAAGYYKVRLYATVFGEESFSNAQSRKFAGVKLDYNILPEYSSSGRSSLLTDFIRPDSPRSVGIPFGSSVGATGVYSYRAYDPMLVHNDSSLASEDGRSSNAFGEAIPGDGECDDWVGVHGLVADTPVLSVMPGYIVAVRFSRSAPPSGSPYTGRMGFMGLRWSLVEVDSADVASADRTSRAEDVVARLSDVARGITSRSLVDVYAIRDALLAIVRQMR